MVKRKASRAISKTKARAMRSKTGSGALAFKAKTEGTPRDVLLGQLMEQYLLNNDDDEADERSNNETESLSFADILSRLGMNDRNTKWRNAWKDLHTNGLTEKLEPDASFFTSRFYLTKRGRKEASTDELKEVMAKSKAKTNKTFESNDDLHDYIKCKLMNQRGEQIFDLLLQDYQGKKETIDGEHGLSRKELAKLLGISDTGAYFSYALQQLKDLGYAENVKKQNEKGSVVRLTDKAFLKAKESLRNEDDNKERVPAS